MNDEKFNELENQYRVEKAKRKNVEILKSEVERIEEEIKDLNRYRCDDKLITLEVRRTWGASRTVATFTEEDAAVFMNVLLAKKKERLAQLELELI